MSDCAGFKHPVIASYCATHSCNPDDCPGNRLRLRLEAADRIVAIVKRAAVDGPLDGDEWDTLEREVKVYEELRK